MLKIKSLITVCALAAAAPLAAQGSDFDRAVGAGLSAAQKLSTEVKLDGSKPKDAVPETPLQLCWQRPADSAKDYPALPAQVCVQSLEIADQGQAKILRVTGSPISGEFALERLLPGDKGKYLARARLLWLKREYAFIQEGVVLDVYMRVDDSWRIVETPHLESFEYWNRDSRAIPFARSASQKLCWEREFEHYSDGLRLPMQVCVSGLATTRTGDDYSLLVEGEPFSGAFELELLKPADNGKYKSRARLFWFSTGTPPDEEGSIIDIYSAMDASSRIVELPHLESFVYWGHDSRGVSFKPVGK